MRLSASLFILVLAPVAACTGNVESGQNTRSANGDIDSRPEQEVGNFDAEDAKIVANPTAPQSPGGEILAWNSVEELVGVRVSAERDSVTIIVPVVDGVRDYRAFKLTDEVALTYSGEEERVENAHIFCAGFRQRNRAALETPQLLRRIQVADVGIDDIIVVEAVDRLCPFVGVRGNEEHTLEADSSELEDYEGSTDSKYRDLQWVVDVPIRTEESIRAQYGSLIENGHAPSPILAHPAPVEHPAVLARTTVQITSLEDSPVPATFFADFSEPMDITLIDDDLPDAGRTQRGKLYQSEDLSIYTYGAEYATFFQAEGRLQTVLADWAQDIFSSNIIYPKTPVQLSNSDYLHITFEAASNATQRRYWWLSLCGAEEAGQTLDAEGKLTGGIIQTAFFYQDDGRNPSVEGWNCLQIFPRDGWPFDLEPTDERPESDIRVMVNEADEGVRDSVVNVSPDQYDNPSIAKPGWFRQMDANGELADPILDDEMLIAPRTHYDIFVRRDRVVMFVNGEQRLCNEFPDVPLTMAEGALGFGHVLYHSSAERIEFFRSFNDRTGQIYLLNNTPYIDARSWDNLGYEEGTGLPSNYDESVCFSHTR